jgi:GNAT superfamily N-acetyltransferase
VADTTGVRRRSVETELGAALAFERLVRRRGAQRAVELDGGLVVLHDGLKTKYHLNALLLDAPLRPGLDADAIMRLADEHLGHRGHRHVVLDDGPAAERLAPGFLDAGWTIERIVYMSWCREADRPPRPGVAREISDAEAREHQLAFSAEEQASAPSPDGLVGAVERSLVGTLVAGQQALRAGTMARCFGAGENGQLAASCVLFLERDRGGIAMIDEVGTLSAYRRRGLGRAVVAAALDSARASGCTPIVIPADHDDWPKRLYARMGFEPLGIQASFTRR